MATIAILGGCATQFADFETGTQIGQLMRSSQAETLDDLLQKAAFAMVAGKTASEIRTTLTADGATCSVKPALTCVWTVDRRETAFDVAAGIRPPGPTRTWRLDYAVRFDTTPIRTLGDVVATVRSNRID